MNDNNHQRQQFTADAALAYLKKNGVIVPVSTFYRWIKNKKIESSRDHETALGIKIRRDTLDLIIAKS